MHSLPDNSNIWIISELTFLDCLFFWQGVILSWHLYVAWFFIASWILWILCCVGSRFCHIISMSVEVFVLVVNWLIGVKLRTFMCTMVDSSDISLVWVAGCFLFVPWMYSGEINQRLELNFSTGFGVSLFCSPFSLFSSYSSAALIDLKAPPLV